MDRPSTGQTEYRNELGGGCIRAGTDFEVLEVRGRIPENIWQTRGKEIHRARRYTGRGDGRGDAPGEERVQSPRRVHLPTRCVSSPGASCKPDRLLVHWVSSPGAPHIPVVSRCIPPSGPKVRPKIGCWFRACRSRVTSVDRGFWARGLTEERDEAGMVWQARDMNRGEAWPAGRGLSVRKLISSFIAGFGRFCCCWGGRGDSSKGCASRARHDLGSHSWKSAVCAYEYGCLLLFHRCPSRSACCPLGTSTILAALLVHAPYHVHGVCRYSIAHLDISRSILLDYLCYLRYLYSSCWSLTIYGTWICIHQRIGLWRSWYMHI